MDLGVAGLASGFDWKALVEQLAEVERAPQRSLRLEQSAIQQRNIAYGGIKTQLAVLQNKVDALKDPALFDSRSVSAGSSTVLSAKVDAAAPLGSYSFNVSQLATASVFKGASNTGGSLHSSNDVSGLALKDANFGSAISAGVISVNGKQVAIGANDTLQDVFNNISAATSGSVTASYDSTTDTISLASASEIVLGSAGDTSNFLQAAKLFNNGTGAIASATPLGAMQVSEELADGNFATPISDGGGGAGEFKINGASIRFNASTESLSNIMDKINTSEAGVIATYDTANDRLVLTNKTTGDVGVGLEDVTGNFLAATGLTGGTLERGKDLNYTINGGGVLTSRSNVISEASSGLKGLTVTALAQGTTTVQVSSDTAKIRAAINDFISEYNKVQSVIDTQTASSTDSKGKVTKGTLAGERDAQEISSGLRSRVFSEISGFSTVMNHLADMGISTSGTSNALTISDGAALDTALNGNLAGVKKLFTDSSSGLATGLTTYISSLIGDKGTLVSKQNTLTTQSGNIDTQVANQERIVQTTQSRLTASFVAMEAAQARITQQLQFLQKNLGQQ